MASGEQSITCAANIGAGCATLADATITGGVLTILAGAVGATSLFSDQQAKSEIENEIAKIKTEIYASLERYAGRESDNAAATIDAVYLALDKHLPNCLPNDDDLVIAGVAPSEIGILLIDKLTQVDERFSDDQVWKEVTRRIIVGAFDRAFESRNRFLSLGMKISAEIMRRQGIHQRENQDQHKAVLGEFAAIRRELQEHQVVVDPGPLEDQLRAFYKSNDVEAQEALKRGVPGDGLTDLSALNRKRVADIKEHQSLLELEILATARSLRAEGAAYFLSGRISDAKAAYESAISLEPDDFSTLISLGRIAHLHGQLREAVERFELARGIALTQRDLSVSLTGIGDVLIQQGKLAEAVVVYEESLATRRRLAEDETNAGAQRDLSISLERVGDINEARGDMTSAIRRYDESLPIAERLAGLDTTNAEWARDVEITRRRLQELRAKKS